MNQSIHVFVYGTLRQHESNHHFLNKAKCMARQAWTNGVLYDTGQGYPAMVLNKERRVYGEVYEINSLLLKKLDELEDYEGEGRDNLYDRVVQKIHTDFGLVDAHVYVFKPDQITDLEEIPFGDWRCHLHLTQEDFLYFAYGSCMDDERFEQAGVKQEFSKVIGCGMAKNYKVAYTCKSHDGGRADMVESEGIVEGKVYQINQKTLKYLFRREGVKDQIYRPAFIEVVIDGIQYDNALTFFVIDKEEEVAPPEHYYTEILRGAKGLVSDAYFHKLNDDLAKNFGIKP